MLIGQRLFLHASGRTLGPSTSYSAIFGELFEFFLSVMFYVIVVYKVFIIF